MNQVSPQQEMAGKELLPLYNGDRMTQKEFHRRYQQYPKKFKFELVGGTVFLTSLLRYPHEPRYCHGLYEEELSFLFGLYRRATPGVELVHNTTAILGEESEPQPDLTLRIRSEYGGQSEINEDEYIKGSPELLAEVAYSTRALDMHGKREDYQQAGVLEYLVLCIEEKELYWFHFPSGKEIKPNREGISRSKVFPGLWLDGPGLLERNSTRLMEVVQQGLASKEHAAFLKKLETTRKKNR